jgi:hypothetical protein
MTFFDTGEVTNLVLEFQGTCYPFVIFGFTEAPLKNSTPKFRTFV